MRRALLIATLLALGACDAQIANVEQSAAQTGPQTIAPANLPAFFDCLRTEGGVLVSAHRGGPTRGFAENAIPTFANTLSNVPAFLEVDIARTRDGALVLMHDDTVDRTTDGTGAISSMTVSTFQALNLHDDDGTVLDAHPPTLLEALEWADGKTVLELDVKRGVSYEDVVRDVEDAGAMGRVIFITYSIDGAARIASIAPEAMIYTTFENIGEVDALARRRGVDLSNIVAWLGADELDEGLVEALAARDIESRWGLFDRNADFATAVEAGVEGVSVNRPEAAFRAIDAADGQGGYAAGRCAR